MYQNKTHSHPSKTHGFTIVEILVALVVFSIFISALAGWMKSSNESRIQNAFASASNRIFGTLEKDVLAGRSIVDPTTLNAQLSGAKLLSFVSDPSGLLKPELFTGKITLEPMVVDGLKQGKYQLKICYLSTCIDKTILSKTPIKISNPSNYGSYLDQGTLKIQYLGQVKPVQVMQNGTLIQTVTNSSALPLDNGIYQIVDSNIPPAEIDPSIVTIQGGRTSNVNISYEPKTTGLELKIDPKLPIAPEVILGQPDGKSLTVRESRVWRGIPQGQYRIDAQSFTDQGFEYRANAITPFYLMAGQQEVKTVQYLKQSGKITLQVEGLESGVPAPSLEDSAGKSWALTNGSNALELLPGSYRVVTPVSNQYQIEVEPTSAINLFDLAVSDQKRIDINYQVVEQNSIGIYFDHNPQGDARVTGDGVDLEIHGNSTVTNLADGTYSISSTAGTPTPSTVTLGDLHYQEVHIK